jgi:hypothetical protein
MLRKIMAALLVVGTLAGCMDPSAGTGKYHKWFNPQGQEVSDELPPECSGLARGTHPDPPYPPELPPGIVGDMSWADYRLEVFAVKMGHNDAADTDYEFCVPVSIHIYGQANGHTDWITLWSRGSVITMPHDGLYDTPYGAEAVVGWKNTDLPPSVSWELSANYESGPDFAAVKYDGAVGLVCQIRMNGILLAHTLSININGPKEDTGAGSVKTNQFVSGPFVRCTTPLHKAIPAV